MIVGTINDERKLSHQEQVALQKYVVKTLKQKVQELENQDRELVGQLEVIRRKSEDLDCGQQKKRRPMV